MANKLLEDKEGNKSSKRVMGFICVVTGLLLALIVSIIYILMAIKGTKLDIVPLGTIFASIFSTGTLLLGVCTFEKKQMS